MDRAQRPPRRRLPLVLAAPFLLGALAFAASLVGGPATVVEATASERTAAAASDQGAVPAPVSTPVGEQAAPAGGHVAPPKAPPAGPDLRPLGPGAVEAPGAPGQVPAAFAPDPLGPVPDIGPNPFSPSTGRDRSRDQGPTPEERRKLVEFGKELFNSSTAFGQQPSKGPRVFGERLSCATCHSGPAFTDNRTHLVGPTVDRPIVPRQTPHLLKIGVESAPFGWDGRNPSLENQARGAIVSPLEMHASREPTPRELAALVAFMETIEGEPAMPGVDFDPAMAAVGEKLFKEKRGIDPSGEFSPNVKISCETCHIGPLFTDRKPHRILMALGDPADPGHVDPDNSIRGFDTPPLVGLRFTAPYFHDGLAGDPTSPSNVITGKDFARRALRDNVLNFYNARFNFGFSDDQLNALTEFLLSL